MIVTAKMSFNLHKRRRIKAGKNQVSIFYSYTWKSQFARENFNIQNIDKFAIKKVKRES